MTLKQFLSMSCCGHPPVRRLAHPALLLCIGLSACQTPPPPPPAPRVVEQTIDFSKRPRVVDGPEGARIVFPAGLLFEFDKADLGASAQGHIDDCGFIYQRARGAIIVEGHTDSIGSPARNQTLSRQRAEVVQQELIKRKIAPSRITVRALAATKPDTDVDGVAFKDPARHRRAEVILAGETVSSLGAQHGCGAPPAAVPAPEAPPPNKPKGFFEQMKDMVQEVGK